ncbi:MAG: hypothetical protein AB8C95_03400 [Phycisphaeraceae bacterium]
MSVSADEPPAVEQTAQVEAEAQDKTQDKPAERTADEIRGELNQLTNKQRELQQELQMRLRPKNEVKPEPTTPDITSIVLPANPSRDQVETYIADLRGVAEKLESVSSADPTVDRLMVFPSEHFDLVLEQVAQRTRMFHYVENALRRMDADDLRKGCAAAVNRTESAIALNMIILSGWTKDIQSVIETRLKSDGGEISLLWFQAAVDLGDPALYPKLHEATINSPLASQFIDILKSLPDYDLTKTIDACWERANNERLSISPSSLALQFAELGNVEALGTLIAQLPKASRLPYIRRNAYSLRLNVLQLIDTRGSNVEIQEWYAANKDQLAFDRLSQRFILPEDF